jgi:hypothetical protein
MTQPAVAERRPASVWTRILDALHVLDDALSTNELEYVERRLEKLERELSTLKMGRSQPPIRSAN